MIGKIRDLVVYPNTSLKQTLTIKPFWMKIAPFLLCEQLCYRHT